MKGSNLQYFLIGAFVVASGLSVLAVTIPNTFTAGSPIKAAEVNANFSALKNAVDPLESFKAKLSSTPCASGQAMSGVGADGSSSCVALGPGGGGLTKVEHDNTLSGDGTAVSKLGINLPLNLVTSASDAYVLKVENATNNNAGPTLVLNNSGSGDLVQAFNGGNLNFKVLNSGNVVFPQTLGQKLNLWGSDYGIGIQSNTLYSRIDDNGTNLGGFAWYKGGTHSDNTLDAGGGTTLMILYRNGNLEIIGEVYGKQFNNTSDRNAKANFRRVDSLEVLGKVARLPISSWNYKSDPASVRHIGPTAQDFKAAFGLNGADDKHISTIDEGGVALAAIQGLYELNRQLTNENKALQERLTALEQRLAALEAR